MGLTKGKSLGSPIINCATALFCSLGFILAVGCTTPAYLVNHTSDGGEIELISPDGGTFSEGRERAQALMTEVCGASQPTVTATETKAIPYYSINQDETVIQRRQYLTFHCGEGSSSRMPASVNSR